MMPGMQFVDAGGVSTHVKVWGSGPPVVLIHGAASDLGVFEPTLVPKLKSAYRLIAYDRPGMGFSSDRPVHAGRLDVQARIAAGVIEALGLERPLVLAHSYGGAVALRLALDHPDKVSGLVLIAPAAHDWPGDVAWHYHLSSAPMFGQMFNQFVVPAFAEAAARTGLAQAFAPDPVPDGYEQAAGVMRAIRPSALAANAEDLINIKRELVNQAPRYPTIRHAVGLLTGDQDRVVSPLLHARALARELPLVRHIAMEGSGHLPHERNPKAVRELLEWARTTAGAD
jgi:pimeloyl-ACP methyl ester carboxylesterase